LRIWLRLKVLDRPVVTASWGHSRYSDEIRQERKRNVTLGSYRNQSVRRIKGNQATFDNSQRNNLRSCVWVSVVVLVRMVVLVESFFEDFPSLLISVRALVRPGDSAPGSPEAPGHGGDSLVLAGVLIRVGGVLKQLWV